MSADIAHIPTPLMQAMRQSATDAAELEELRQWWRDLEETQARDLVHELAQLRRVRAAAERLDAKLVEHKRRCYGFIKVGAGDELHELLRED